ncbi:hypothetical protein GCM10009104_30250 [Marinobacterium maritimum]|uniref:Uncharacterized protein n=1 Tax=Marinobacterium maritimum TaxID=500162 RepID=A0ABN1I9I4_9GAMM
MVGDQCEAVVVAQSHPAAAGAQVASAEYGQVWPDAQWLGRALVKFVTVGHQYQRPVGVSVEGKYG